MFVRLITNVDELNELSGPWNTLAGGEPMRSWDWLATWWKHYGSADCHLNVLAVYRGRERDAAATCDQKENADLIGIAPWYRRSSLVSGDVLYWLGDGEVCTDHSTLICRAADSQFVADALAKALTETHCDWDRLDLTAVDADDAAINALVAALSARDCTVTRHPTGHCWILDLPRTWDEYLASVSKSHRKQLRQLERRVLNSTHAAWHCVTSTEELAAAWPILVDLHQRRRQSLGEPGCFASQRFHDFHRDLAERLLERGQLRLSWLAVDGQPIAAEYHFAGPTATYAYQGGVNPTRLADEPGRLSTILCLRAAIAEGHRHFDFLRGDEPYKAHWRATPRPTFAYRVTPNRTVARLRGDVLNAAKRMTDWVKQGPRILVGTGGGQSE
jgi:hypothetical protein